MLYKRFLTPLLFILFSGKLLATHFYGVDLFYTHVSGNTYRVSLVAYGDCSGVQFPSFATQRPLIYVRKGTTPVMNDFLDEEPPKDGIEVTPVCPSELNNTTCVSPAGTVPGVKKFTYSKEFTLSGPAPDWKFVFLGTTDGTTQAGRSNSLTNVSPVGNISLEASLDNTHQNNSSPQYTTIATPFYCVSKPTNFNPGAVDADGDSLVYELVPGLDGLLPLNYVSGYSASHPLDVVAGTFSFSSNSGQLSFTPRSLQKSLVVYRVSEYRNGALIGTSMREMTVVVMPCDNNPPAGSITNASGASIVDDVTVKTCSGNHEVAFDINPKDADNGSIINMVASGLPQNATLDITNNHTTHPLSRFDWNMPSLPEGDYIFYITYTDDGCPLASKQTQAYTIRIGKESIHSETIAGSCIDDGIIKVIVPPDWLQWGCNIFRDNEQVYNTNGIAGSTWSLNMPPGNYQVYAFSDLGCTADTFLEIPAICDTADLPTAFSPNGDGKNDILYVRGGNIRESHLTIFNRWGQQIFESSDIRHGWDGTYKGQNAPTEAYAYVLSVVFTSGRKFQKKGNVTLLR